MRYVTDDRSTIEASLNMCHKLLMAAGFEYKRTIQSAMYERRYQCPRTLRVVSIDGWHGTGKGSRNYGDGFTIHSAWLSHGGRLAGPGNKTVIGGEQERVDVGGPEVSLSVYDFAPSGRCIFSDDAARDRVMRDVKLLPNTLATWLDKTA